MRRSMAAARALGRRAVGQVGLVAFAGVDDRQADGAGTRRSARAAGTIAGASSDTSLPSAAPKPPGSRKSRCMSMIDQRDASRAVEAVGKRQRVVRASASVMPRHVAADGGEVCRAPESSRRRCGRPTSPAMRSDSSSSSSRSSLTSSTAAPRLRAATIRPWISATAAKSSPNTGLAAISTSTSPDSSRASTARCTLPPDSVAIGASGDERLDPVARDQLARRVAHRAAGAASQPLAQRLSGRSCGTPCCRRRSCAATQALRSGSSGRQRHVVAQHLRARRADRARRSTVDRAGGARALAGQNLDQLALAVAGNAGDADDLARAHLDGRRRAAPSRPSSSSASSPIERQPDRAARRRASRDGRRADLAARRSSSRAMSSAVEVARRGRRRPACRGAGP